MSSSGCLSRNVMQQMCCITVNENYCIYGNMFNQRKQIPNPLKLIVDYLFLQPINISNRSVTSR